MSNFISASPRLSLEQNNPISFLQRFSIIFLYELAIHIFYKTWNNRFHLTLSKAFSSSMEAMNVTALFLTIFYYFKGQFLI